MDGRSSRGYPTQLALPGIPAQELPAIEWDPASIFEHVFRRMKPRTQLPEIQVEFRPFANMNHTIRLEEGRILVKLSDLLRHAPPKALEAIAVILLSKLYRRPVPEKFNLRYRRYVNSREVRRKIQQIRLIRGRKHKGSASGLVYDLTDLFQGLNLHYFDGLLGQPVLTWSRWRSRTSLGHFDPDHNTIVVSRLLDSAEVPRMLVEFILFHEMLHLKHPVEHCGGRRRVHPPSFVREEKKFAHYREAQKLLKAMALAPS